MNTGTHGKETATGRTQHERADEGTGGVGGVKCQQTGGGRGVLLAPRRRSGTAGGCLLRSLSEDILPATAGEGKSMELLETKLWLGTTVWRLSLNLSLTPVLPFDSPLPLKVRQGFLSSAASARLFLPLHSGCCRHDGHSPARTHSLHLMREY